MKQNLFKTWLMLLCLFLGIGSAWAEDFTLSSANEVTQNGITVSFSKTGSGTSPTWYAAGLRLYPGCTVTISSETNITGITFNWEKQGTKAFATNVTASVGTYNHPSSAGTGTWSGSAKSVTFTVNGSSVQLQLNTLSVTTSGGGSTNPVDASWSVEPTSVSVKETTTATATITTNYDGTLSVSPANSSIATATINGKVITVTGVAEGNTTLNVTGAATSSYNAINKTIDVTVTANARPENEIFYESFDTNDGTGGNDDKWSGSIASNSIAQDNDGWVYQKGNGAKECAKFGTGSALGSATTPALGQACNATLTFKAAAWNGNSESTTLKLSVINGGSVSPATVTMTKGAWKDFEVTLTNLTAESKIKFEGNATSNSRFFLDEVSIVKTGEATPEKTLSSIAVKTAPTKVEYTEGDKFDPAGLVITATYSDASTENVDYAGNESKFSFEPTLSTALTAANTSVTITYGGKTTTQTISVTVPEPVAALTTMDEIFAAAITAGSSAADCTVTFNNWVVSGVKGNNAYVTDNAGKGFIVYASGHGFVVGDILSGTAACKVQLYNGSAELTNLSSSTTGLTVTKGGVLTPVTSIALASLSGINTGAVISYENLEYDGTNFTDGETSLTPYSTFITLPTLIEGKNYNVTGVYIQYNETKEIAPRTADDFKINEVINTYIVTFDETLNGTITVKDGETVINDGDEVAEGTTLTIECTPTDAETYRFKNWQYKEGEAAWATRQTNPQDYTMPSANVRFKATFEEIPIYTVTYMSLGSSVGTELVKDGNKIANAPSVSLTDWTFVGWTTNGSYADSETSPIIFDEIITGPTTLHAVFSQGENGAAGSASLTNDEICDQLTGSYADGSITNAYGTWNYNAAKQGNVSKDGEYFMQLRNNNLVSYLQIPEMTGNITSIVLGRVCNTSKGKYTGSIYFRSEKSNDATAIATATQSTALTDVTLTIPEGYKTGYVMVSGPCRIESVTVNYTTGGSKTYTITGPLTDAGTINFVATTGDGKYYATFSSTRAIKFDEAFINEDETCAATIKAYAISVVDGELYRTDQYKINNDGNYTYIPANTGVLFEYTLEEGTFDGTVPYEYADAEADYLSAVEDNMLVACPTTGACPTVEGDNLYYKLAYGNANAKTGLGFWYGAEDGSNDFNVKAGGAVLVVPQSAGGAVRGFSFDGNNGVVTGLNNLNSLNNTKSAIYNLQGQRISKALKGVNIVNGRKVIR